MSDRFTPRAIDPEGVADGDYSLNVTGGHVTGLTPATPGGGGGVAVEDEGSEVAVASRLNFTGSGVTVTSTGAGEATVAIPGDSGGSSGQAAGDGKGSFDQPPSTSHAMDDEFNDGPGSSGPTNGLATKWTKEGLATSSWLVLDDALAPGGLLFDVPAGSAVTQAIHQPAPTGDFRAVAKAHYGSSSERNLWALFLVDTTGYGVGMCVDDGYTSDVYSRLRELNAWTLTGVTAAQKEYSRLWAMGVPTWISLRRSGTTYYGTVWASSRIHPTKVREISLAPTFTPAYLGFGRVSGSNQAAVLLDAFRVTA